MEGDRAGGGFTFPIRLCEPSLIRPVMDTGQAGSFGRWHSFPFIQVLRPSQRMSPEEKSSYLYRIARELTPSLAASRPEGILRLASSPAQGQQKPRPVRVRRSFIEIFVIGYSIIYGPVGLLFHISATTFPCFCS